MDFSASINPLGPPTSAIAAIQSNLPHLTAYPDPNYTELRAALGQFHRIEPEWILPGNGAAELLTWACRDLAELERVELPTPAFGDYRRALAAFGATVLERPLLEPQSGRWGGLPPSEPIQGAVGLLLNNPHNPTGCLFSRHELLAYLKQYELVVVDEAFMDFLPPETEQSLMDWLPDWPNLVIVRSLTKFYSLPGLRLGYAIAHPNRLRRWQQWRDPWTVNSLAAAVGAAITTDDAFQQQTWNWLAPARDELFARLSQLPGLRPYPGAANFLLVQTDISSVELQRQLLTQHQVLIRDCLSFPELGERYFRVAIRTPEDNHRLLDALQAVIASTHKAS